MKKTQPIKTCPQITEMLKLADKDIKISIINMLDMKHIKKVKEKKNHNEERKRHKKTQTEILVMKNILAVKIC